METLYLNDLLHFSKEEFCNIKIKFNQSNGFDEPMDLYQRDPNIVNNQWLFWRNKQRYFNVGQIAVCFLKLSSDTWLLTTIKKVTKEFDVYNGINYDGEELEKYKPYYGRVVVKFHKKIRLQGFKYATICDDLEIQQILPTIFDGDDFSGYDKVNLSFMKLASLLNRGKRDWIAALENQKAVYLITDKENGKMYVGSATSEYGMLLQRWKSYIANGHGGNKELLALVNSNGFEYVKANFCYSILENYNAKVDDGVILQRESWWKETLQTRKFGYNNN